MDKDLTITRGDTFAFEVEFENLTEPLNSANFTCRNIRDEQAIFFKTIGDGIELVSTEPTTYKVRVAPEDTIDVKPGRYCYDFEIGLDEDIWTLLKGHFYIESDVTY